MAEGFNQGKGTRRPEKALTAAQVRTLTKAGKYFDGHGLFLKVNANGSKQWVQRIVIRGKRREIGLGNPSLVSLADARAQALENRQIATRGGDPVQIKRETQAVLTFEEAARRVHAIHLPTWKNKKHGAQFISTLETYAFPRIGKIRVADVNTSEVLAVLTPIWTDKAETARRVRQRMGMVFKWAVAQGWRQDNPAESIAQALPRHDKQQEHRKALPYQDVTQCVDTIKASRAHPLTKLAFEMIVLTATRSGEVRGATWEEFDLTANVWTIPKERMKAKRPHRIPLCSRAVAILEEARQYARDDAKLVFEGAKAGRPMSDVTLLKLVREQGFNVDIHGFRTSFRTWVQEQTNFPYEVAEAAMAHTKGDKAEAAYARSDMFEKRRKMMDAWGVWVSGNMGQVIEADFTRQNER